MTLRGTLGFYDFIIDLEFDYVTINYNGKDYHVHSGIYQSAKIISQPNSVIHNIVRVALNDYPDYGLILCGHSLGGGVASMLGLLWIDPNKPYVTSAESKLPPNRPLHVYSYGTPSCMQEELSILCRTFVTSVVNHYDIIPRLSIGILTDLRNCADELLDEKNHGLAEEIFSRSLATFNKSNSGKELNWFWEKFLLFKKTMNTEKLVPPGVVYIIETADIPLKESCNYEINNLPEMPLYDDALDSNCDNKRHSDTFNKNSEYVDMIINSIHPNGVIDTINEETVVEKNKIIPDTNNNMDTDQDIEMNEVTVALMNRNSNNNNVNGDHNSINDKMFSKTTLEKKGKEKENERMDIDEDEIEEIQGNADDVGDVDADIEESDEDIIEVNVTDENRKRQFEIMKMKTKMKNDYYFKSLFLNKPENVDNNKQGRPYTLGQAQKTSKYYSRTPSTLHNKNNDNLKRVILLRCDDVKEQFSELAFAKCMFFDHAPVNYENLLNALEHAIFKTS